MVPHARPPDLGVPELPDQHFRRIRVTFGAPASRPSLIPGLTSRAHQYTTGVWWQNGVVFHEPTQNAWAVAELSSDRGALTLTVSGSRPEAFFSHLRAAIEDRLSEWPGLEPMYYVLCPMSSADGALCAGSWAHQELVAKHEMGRQTEDCTACRTGGIAIPELLGHLPTSTVTASIVDRRERLAARFESEDILSLVAAIESSTQVIELARSEQVDRHSQLMKTIESEFAVSRHDTYSQFRATLDFLGQEIKDTPRLASIHPSDGRRVTLNPNTWFNESWELRLWCEHPGHEHPLDEAHSFKSPSRMV